MCKTFLLILDTFFLFARHEFSSKKAVVEKIAVCTARIGTKRCVDAVAYAT